MANYRVSESQSLIDIAIQTCGGLAAAFDLAVANDITISDELTPAQTLKLVSAIDTDIVNYYIARNLVPATALTDEDKLVAAELEGISYWAINVDFIVQWYGTDNRRD